MQNKHQQWIVPMTCHKELASIGRQSWDVRRSLLVTAQQSDCFMGNISRGPRALTAIIQKLLMALTFQRQSCIYWAPVVSVNKTQVLTWNRPIHQNKFLTLVGHAPRHAMCHEEAGGTTGIIFLKMKCLVLQTANSETLKKRMSPLIQCPDFSSLGTSLPKVDHWWLNAKWLLQLMCSQEILQSIILCVKPLIISLVHTEDKQASCVFWILTSCKCVRVHALRNKPSSSHTLGKHSMT